MKQILQNLKTGATLVADVPCPAARPGHLLVRSNRTLISTGTERMLVDFGRAGWLNKARQQPDKVRMVLDKIRTDGLAPTLEAVFDKLDQPLPLGYCNVGEVIGVGSDVASFLVGDRVVSNGRHAEVVSVPMNLCARVPEGVTDDAAAFTVLAAIALQGIRLAQPTLGEAIVVTGLGLIGLTTVQLLRAQGCRVLGIDFDADKLSLARKFGAEVVNPAAGEDPIAAARSFSRGRGVDAVLITASTKSNEPVHQAATMCRKRGRIVLVGVVGLELSRSDFYEKELSFQVSCSYGPGRHDPNYEEKGQDYPVAFVRWTEQRNFEAVLDMMADGRLDAAPLITHRFPIDEAPHAYELVGTAASSLGIMLEYPSAREQSAHEVRYQTVTLLPARAGVRTVCAFVGSGSYATRVLMPAFKATGTRLKVVASSGGLSGIHGGRKFGFEEATTDVETVFSDPQVTMVVVATRHDSHASLVCRALTAGKHVFVEKPLCLNSHELTEIERIAGSATGLLMVGFNRRFAPQIQRIKKLLAAVHEPKAFIVTVNAGEIATEHWTQDRSIGGGRIIGEACHFIDLLRFLAGVPFVEWRRSDMVSQNGDTITMQLRFADGSVGTVHYFANGSKAFPKERLEVFCAGKVLQMDNFRRLTGFGWTTFKKENLWRQDKGQVACAAAFVRSVEQGDRAPIPLTELVEVARVSIELANDIR